MTTKHEEAIAETKRALEALENLIRTAREQGIVLTQERVGELGFNLATELKRLEDASPFLPAESAEAA